MQFEKMLQNYFMSRNEAEKFTAAINAKNTRGLTTLDYIEYVYSTKRFAKMEEAGINRFTKYLCDNGAKYSVYRKTCPAEYINLSNQPY